MMWFGVCVCVSVVFFNVCVYAPRLYPWTPEVGIGFLGTGVTDGCGLSVGAAN